MTFRKRLKLMPEIQCWAIWDMDRAGNLDPASLPISEALADDLNKWSDRYDAIYKLNEPNFQLDINFTSAEEEDRFYDDGWRLLARLKAELPEVEWWYRDHRYDGILSKKPATEA